MVPPGTRPPAPPADQPPAQTMDTSVPPPQREARPEETAPLCAAAAAMHPLPQSSSPSIFPSSSGMRESSMVCPSVPAEHPAQAGPDHFPVPGEYVPSNQWNISILKRHIPGPLGSFLRHATTTQSPLVPNYVTTQRYPVPRVGNLRTKPTYENIIAHQSYLEKLQFEQNSLRCWSNIRGQKNRPRKKTNSWERVPRNFSDQSSLDFACFLCLFSGRRAKSSQELCSWELFFLILGGFSPSETWRKIRSWEKLTKSMHNWRESC